ncbi:hypothetical protein SAMN05216488_0426 [Microbacterium sp. LKL04]|uniref:AbiTii domain-containing protein n=1 Tax=Microbacterium sp. LKL04 TaxID=912630 RepID=UPI000875AE73|nr:hypothetical protein [Microbacterium sp. LKL04]SCY04737.1 hypothetical protein SAMN05216488_0426 [Microbacterium sp. LKL04]
MGLLDEIIDGASSDGVSTTNLLRKVQTVAHRVGATELRQWVRAELDGYAEDAPLPAYRGPYDATVKATWAGPFNSSAQSTLSTVGVPTHFLPLFKFSFRQAAAELEVLAGQGEELGQPWNPYALAEYNELVEKEEVPHFDMMGVYSAHRVVTPALVTAIVESIRTKALDLALDLQTANPAAGEVGGPTRDDPAIEQAVMVNINHIYGDGANIAQGNGITQSSTVAKGDLTGLVAALQDLLADAKVIGEAVAIITGDSDACAKKSKLGKIAGSIGTGAVRLAGGITTEVAAAGVLEVASQFLGW